MINLVIAIIWFVTGAYTGYLSYKDGKKDKIPMYVTPWTCRQSWLIYTCLMLSLLSNIIYALRLLSGG